jgi:high affinity sulfate transporter 1
MATLQHSGKSKWVARLATLAPGLSSLRAYKKSDLPHDLLAGLSVGAVAIPVGVAYSQLAGVNPAIGLYSSILPLLAYALFGTSRQLIIGPDAAVCALIGSAVVPLAAGRAELYVPLVIALTFFSGVLCIAASFLKLGGLADFLSKPILVGFLNGVSLSIALGQASKIFGFETTARGIVPRLIELASKLKLTHWPTLGMALGTLVVLWVSPRVLRKVPAPLLALVVGGIAVKLFRLDTFGVKTVGAVLAGFPSLRFPTFPVGMLPDLLAEAVGLALISFSSMMLTARSFASKRRYDIDPDREFAALGVANIASAFSQGFAVTGADSRTAVNDATGGRTQIVGLVAAAVVAAVVAFFTGLLQFVPMAALGAVLLSAAFSLADISTPRMLYRIDRREFVLSILATLGVVGVGAIKAIVVAVLLAIVRFVRLVSRPKVEILGTVKDFPGFHSLERHTAANTVPGLLLFRFNAPIVFFNAPYFRRQALAAAEAAGPDLKWFVIDMIPITMIDATGLYTADELISSLAERGIIFATAGRLTERTLWAKKRLSGGPEIRRFPTLRAALKAYRQEVDSVQSAA